MPCLPIKLFDCACYCRLLIRIHRDAITAARRVTAVNDVFVLDWSTRALVNLLPRHVAGELLAALGYAALLAKNLMLTEAPRRLLPLLVAVVM